MSVGSFFLLSYGYAGGGTVASSWQYAHAVFVEDSKWITISVIAKVVAKTVTLTGAFQRSLFEGVFGSSAMISSR